MDSLRRLAEVAVSPRLLGTGFERFECWREHQLDALARMLPSSRRFIVAELPTGAGKSLLVISLIRLLGTRGMVTVETKQLQRQYLDDFPHAVEMKGRANYSCVLLEELCGKPATAESCIHRQFRGCRSCFEEEDPEPREWIELRFNNSCLYDNSKVCLFCPHRYGDCPYYVAKGRAKRAEVVVTNRAYALNEMNWVGDFSGWPLLVLDEADTVEHTLRGFVELSLSEEQLEKLGFKPPRYKTKWEAWKEWAEQRCDEINRRLAEFEGRLCRGDWELEDAKERAGLESLAKKLRFFLDQVDEYWVSEFEEKRWTFKPVLVSPFSHRFLFDHAEKGSPHIGHHLWGEGVLPRAWNPARRCRFPFLPIHLPGGEPAGLLPASHPAIEGQRGARISEDSPNGRPDTGQVPQAQVPRPRGELRPGGEADPALAA